MPFVPGHPQAKSDSRITDRAVDEADTLLTVAEIGVALAGFASLATVIGQRFKHTDPLVNAIRLRGLLDAGLTAMFLALIAVLLLKIGGPSDWVWRVSSAIGVCFSIPIGWAAWKRDKLRQHLPGYKKQIAVVMFALVGLASVGFAFNSTGLAGAYGFQVYLGILYLLLVVCSTMFVLVIASLLGLKPGSGSEDTQQD